MRIRDTGLLEWDRNAASPGLTLFTTMQGRSAWLIDLAGKVVKEWPLTSPSGGLVQLLPDGRLLSTEADPAWPFKAGGQGGFLREYDWDGRLLWEFHAVGQHHDARRLPNGNTIYIGWEEMTPENARRVQGGVPGTEVEGGLIYSDFIREITPDGATAWEWHARDLPIEDYPLAELSKRDEFGHANSCFPTDDAVLVSFRRLNTVLLIDRKTKGVRWRRTDQSWGGQHDAQYLPNGNLLLFANGFNVIELPASRVLELDASTGETVWEYKAQPPISFFSPHISGAQRLPSGNTLICEGAFGRIFEVTPDSRIVWEYICPFFNKLGADVRRLGPVNWVFRAYRYQADSPELAGRI